MPRFNKIIERNFTEVDYKKFLDVDKSMGLNVSPVLDEMKTLYGNLIEERKEDLKSLASLEEIIIQIRSKEVIDSELRLSLSKDYIYARSLFFRKGNKMNDIRVLIGKTETFGGDLNTLINDQDFRSICKTKLIDAMEVEITKNINQLKEVYNERFTS